MGGGGSAIWKVHGENKYFKKMSDTHWAEFDNGRHVFDFDYISHDGSNVYLKKRGWLMFLRLGPNNIIYGESQNNLDKHLYNGGWVNSDGDGNNTSSPQYYQEEEEEPEFCYRGGGG
jgi:hypothetical protein